MPPLKYFELKLLKNLIVGVFKVADYEYMTLLFEDYIHNSYCSAAFLNTNKGVRE